MSLIHFELIWNDFYLLTDRCVNFYLIYGQPAKQNWFCVFLQVEQNIALV